MSISTRREFIQTCSAAAVLARRGLFAQSNSAITSAMASAQAAIPLAAADPDRPVYDFHPPANWNNDPNGTIYYRGWHHLFYQFNPTAPRGGNQHWGHARSRDLVNWEHLPIALWPSVEKGERAIFSGGAILAADGRPRLFYTSIGHVSPEQWMAIPADDELIGWEKYPGNPVLTLDAHGPTQIAQWRDPFLFSEAGRTYMVCGGNLNNGQGGGGSVELYRASTADLGQWQFLGVVFRYRDLAIYNVECPNLFKLGGKWVLLMSPQQPCEYFIGDLDLDRCRFVPEVHGILDAGNAYASNISTDEKGRTILWLWGRTNTSMEKGWNGVMVLPRILSLGANGFLEQQPAAEFEQLRGTPVVLAGLDIPAGPPVELDRVRGDCLELEADFVLGGAVEAGFDLRRSPDGKAGTTVRISRNGTLTVGSAHVAISRGLERYRVRVFLDKRAIEVYVNGGEAAIFATVDAAPQDLGVAAIAVAGSGRGFSGATTAGRAGTAAGVAPQQLAGGGRGRGATLDDARIESLRAWLMKPAAFNLDRFHM